jgi:hypothetical protein
VDKHRGKALTLLWSIRQAAIPHIHPRHAGNFMRLRTYAQTGLWKTGMNAATRPNPASRPVSAMWMKLLDRFNPHDSAANWLQQFSNLFSIWLKADGIRVGLDHSDRALERKRHG